MKNLISTKCSAGAFNVAMLVLRVGFGVLIVPNGYNKLVHFARIKPDFINFLGMGNTVSLALLIFAEFLCASLVVIGLVTRLAAIPLVIAMTVAVWKAHNWQIFGEGQMAAMFGLAFAVVAIAGPGKISVDGAMGK